jgi:proline iminopeptidase
MPRIFMARFLKQSIPGRLQKDFMEDFLMADYEAAMGTIYTAVSKKATEVMPVQYSQITIPTLLISGEYDQIIPAEMGRQAADLSPAVTQVVIPNTSHFPMLEDPDRYLHELDQFLQPVAIA